jgi:hypothetical protein
VKKLIAMLLIAGVIVTSAIGCGSSTGTGKPATTPGSGAKTPP